MAASGPVLIAWEHEAIPAIVNAIVGNADHVSAEVAEVRGSI